MSRYPSTISGHIGQATRDNRFADATGPYHLVPMNKYAEKPEFDPSNFITAESRDPTFSSFEAFVLAPSTSSLAIYDKQSSSTIKENKEDVLGVPNSHWLPEGRLNQTQKSSPLKNQVKSSMESQRTVKSEKQSFDTVRSGQSTAEMSEVGSKREEYSWKLFTRIVGRGPVRPDIEDHMAKSKDSDSKSHSLPMKPSSPSATTPKAERQLRKLSVKPVSPFHISSQSLEISHRKSPNSSRSDNNPQKLDTDDWNVSPLGSEKTIRSFAALHRPSTDASGMATNSRDRMIPLVKMDTPTRCKKQSKLTIPPHDATFTLPLIPSPAALRVPSHHRHSRIKSVRTRPVSVSPNTGLLKVDDSRSLRDEDLTFRLGTREGGQIQEARKEGESEDMQVTSGYWDYSIVTGIEGSPSKDYALLLRNASLMVKSSNVSGGPLQQDGVVSSTNSGTMLDKAVHNFFMATTGAPRSSSDRSLTSSSTYPDDTDNPSEHSHSKYSGRCKARHARRRGNRPLSMASLAAPLGENTDANDANRDEAGCSALEAAQNDADELEGKNQTLTREDDKGYPIRVSTPGESSFGQVSQPSAEA